ncbi:mRNA-decapping enzyme 1A [Protopterus annectens]|uniref:mRNA-decapping enzyme 1A n=1 Tax=Protopterus annectens TaxID=7888 RepID=UPI001CFC3770|nr:mRNA-decapping enzyme 1A [Protopterus annectens]
MESIGKAGHSMSLAALKQHDPYINSIVDVTGQVALYTFNSKANEWEKTDVEGTLFMYTRSASPQYGFTIMNRLNMHNLVEPINKDLEFQLQEPFLLYRNSNLSIFSIWFYDKRDCHRIAELMAKVVDLEVQKTKESLGRNTPSKTNGCSEERPIDILEMLSKAKEEYERQVNSGPKHLTVEELFGASLNKNHRSPVAYSKLEVTEKVHQDCFRDHSNQVTPFTYEQSSAVHESVGKCDSPRNIPSSSLDQHESLTQILIPQASVAQSDLKTSPNYMCSSPTFSAASSCELHHTPVFASTSTATNAGMITVQQVTKRMSPLTSQPAEVQTCCAPIPVSGSSQFFTPLTVSSTRIHSVTSLPDQDFLQKIKLTQQQGQLQQNPFNKLSIAPTFPSTVNHLITPESFRESYPKPVTLNSIPSAVTQSLQLNKEVEVLPNCKSIRKKLPLLTSQAAPRTPCTTSVLLSPSVFQQCSVKTESEGKASCISPLSLVTPEPHSTLQSMVLSKHQLQETLLHLIKNDSDFLSTIHEAYLRVLTKNVQNIQL